MRFQPIYQSLIINSRTRRHRIISIKQIDIVRIHPITRFKVIFIRSFTKILNAIIFAIVINNRIATVTAIKAKIVTDRTSKPIADVIHSKIITKIAQNKTLVFVLFWVIREQRIIQPLITILFAERYSDGLFTFDAAVITINLKPS